MKNRAGIALWCAVILAGILYITQTALAEGDTVTARFLLNALLTGSMVVGLMVLTRPRWTGPAPEPVILILAALAGLSLWAVAWWLMDLTNNRLNHIAGSLPRPDSLIVLPDTLFGLELHDASYELEIVFSVVVIPLAQAGLLWGLVQPEIARFVGRWRAAWITGLLSGGFLALTAVQNIAPTLPWGLAALGGYTLIGCVAALAIYLTGSFWAGFAAYASFVYVSFAWREDLLRQFVGKEYYDVGWLTVIVLGLAGAMLFFQVIRFRAVRPSEPERIAGSRLIRLIVPLIVLAVLLIIMAVVEIDTRG